MDEIIFAILEKGVAERVDKKKKGRETGCWCPWISSACSPRSEEPQFRFKCGSEAVDPAEL